MHNTIFIRVLAALLSFILATGVPSAASSSGSVRRLSEVTEAGTLTETTETSIETAVQNDDIIASEADGTSKTETADAKEDNSSSSVAPPALNEETIPDDTVSENKEAAENNADSASVSENEEASAQQTEEPEPAIKADSTKPEKKAFAAAPAAKAAVAETVSISVSQYAPDISSDGSAPLVTITAGGLGDGKYKARIYYKATTASSFNYKDSDLSDNGTAVFNQYPSLSGGKSYEIYAALYLSNSEKARTQTVTINAVKPTINSKDITVSPSFEGQSTGSITVAGDYKSLAYYPYGGSISDSVKISGTTITGLAAGQYYVFTPAYSEGNTYYLKSSSTRVTVGETEAEHYSVSFESDGQSSWQNGDRTEDVIQGSGQTLSYTVSIDSGYRNTHILDSVTVQPRNAKVTTEKTSDTLWTVTVSEITGDVTVSARSKPIPEYTVTLSQAEGAKWTRSSFTIKSTSSRSEYVRSTDNDRYYVTGVEARPAQNASITFSETTGEVYIENVTGDVELIPLVTEKSVPTSITVTDVHFNKNGVYSEESPSIKVTFTLEVRGQFGELVSGATLYFKDDESEVSFVQSRKTDATGAAQITYSYGIPSGSSKADFIALFSTGSGFADTDVTADQSLHLVLQRKADLVLYEDQIIGTAPGENNGRVINVPDNYEIWTGEVHQGALVVGSGAWVSPTGGEFTGLSSGQHILRAGEYADNDTHTFYFASDYADFFVPRGTWRVSVDTAASENVVFTRDTELTAEPGGTVYIFAEPEDGFEITSYTVDRPNYISAASYNENEGYIVLEGITGSVVLTVKAEAIPADEQEAPADNETELIVYEITDGNGSVWLKGSKKTLTFRALAEYEKFVSASLDGKTIPESYYTTRSGSTIITIKPDYLETLSLGKHTLTLEFTDGYASAVFNVKEQAVKGAADSGSDGNGTPKTGDQSGIIALIINLSALILLSVSLLYTKKGKRTFLSLIRRG